MINSDRIYIDLINNTFKIKIVYIFKSNTQMNMN